MLLPLLGLVKNDQYIATELLCELFTQIYLTQSQEDAEKQRKVFATLVHQSLSRSTQFDYGAINAL